MLLILLLDLLYPSLLSIELYLLALYDLRSIYIATLRDTLLVEISVTDQRRSRRQYSLTHVKFNYSRFIIPDHFAQ